MPQHRTVLHADAQWAVERVVQHAAPVQWSPPYVADSQRWVLPVAGPSELRMADQRVLLDGLTALCLPTGLPYQTLPLHAAERVSLVVSAQPGACVPPLQAPAVRTLNPRALWHMRLQWRGGDAAILFLEASVPQVGPLPDKVWRARRFMAQRIAAADGVPWSLQQVADAAHCSLFHLARLFRRCTGMSLHGYRQRLLLASALQRLEDGETDLAGLAYDLGYCSQSHLGAVFRREVGVTLAQARATLRH
ncbi:MAG: AraC family transcriptional regulator [Acidovorax sp.]|uniref:helix-turn-helix transcriptional regulator n=1 Tax=Acidovorax sp. TaxID=1872122 RepID=UPI0039E5A399